MMQHKQSAFYNNLRLRQKLLKLGIINVTPSSTLPRPPPAILPSLPSQWGGRELQLSPVGSLCASVQQTSADSDEAAGEPRLSRSACAHLSQRTRSHAHLPGAHDGCDTCGESRSCGRSFAHLLKVSCRSPVGLFFLDLFLFFIFIIYVFDG